MSRPRPPPLQLIHDLPPTPPSSPDKPQLSTPPAQKTSWTPTKSVRFAPPTPLPQAHHKTKTSQSQTASIFHTYYHRNPKPERKPKRISTKACNASVNRLTDKYYTLYQSLYDLELFSHPMDDIDPTQPVTKTNTSGLTAPPPSPVSISTVKDQNRQTQTQPPRPRDVDKKIMQAMREHAHFSIYKPLTDVAPLLTLPFFPSQEKENEVRRVIKRAKREMKVLEEWVKSEQISKPRVLRNWTLELRPKKKLGMEIIQDGVVRMSLEETPGSSYLSFPGFEADGLLSAKGSVGKVN
ncbi:hypothetical protein B0T20DRAFT_488966 [Sordaria brevicollis]|uniref:Uncharacterized protein n=1 Tax=Sordaria brevicollis TaxID=83679 RepID=A0AAE0P1X7_SORBR|nr:hypothetical protein B0T20DRAFT_488966 [Sordaria brevicollis]